MMWWGFTKKGVGLMITWLLTMTLVAPVWSDHTTYCVQFPKLDSSSTYHPSMGLEKFPQDKALWKDLLEKKKGGIWLTNSVQEHDKRLQYDKSGNPPYTGLEIFKIKDGNGKLLNGWYRVRVRLQATNSDYHLEKGLIMLLLWVRDDSWRRQNIGEFSINFPAGRGGNKCKPNDATKYNVISCGGASKSEPLVSNMIVLVRNDSTLDSFKWPPASEGLPVATDLTSRQELNFYVRIPIQDCNQKRMILFRARFILDRRAIDGYSGHIIRQATAYLRIQADPDKGGIAIPGGSDAIPSPNHAKTITCDEEIKDTNLFWWNKEHTRESTGNLVCIGCAFKNEDFSAHDDPDVNSWALYACQGLGYFSGRCPRNLRDIVVEHTNSLGESEDAFKAKNQKYAEVNVVPLCERQLPKAPFVRDDGVINNMYISPKQFNNRTVPFKKTHKYLKDVNQQCSPVYNGDPKCNISTVVITKSRKLHLHNHGQPHSHSRQSYDDTTDDTELTPVEKTKENEPPPYQNYSGNHYDSIKDRYKGVGFNETGFVKLIWGLRKAHATAMSWAILLVIPVNHFVTRYFKEDFMTSRILYSRVWYVVHTNGVFITAVLMGAGLTIAVIAKNFLSTSLVWQAILHRALGYLAFLIFIILCATGGLRGFDQPLRNITIIVHWAGGTLFYLLMMGCMLTSVFIPGSGVTQFDRSLLWKDMGDGDMILMSSAFWHPLAWMIVELVMHLIMMSNMIAFDRKMVVIERRTYCPVPLPVIKEHSSVNASGHGLRVVCLGIYVFLALLSTAWYFISNIVNVHYNADFGMGPMKCTHDPNTHEILVRFLEKCN